MEIEIEETRKLATIRVVGGLYPIEGADLIEMAEIDGWQCVVKKGEFKEGQLCVYFEIDSFLPIQEQFEFLRKSCFKFHPTLGEGFRIKTIKLRGQISQGLVFPVSVLGYTVPVYFNESNRHAIGFCSPDSSDFSKFLFEGDDVSDILGVRKYEAPVSGAVLSGNAKGNFPTFLKKSDQERVQNLKRTVEDRQNELFEVTMKLDGSSITVYSKDGEVGVCSRNLELKMEDSSTFVDTAKNSGLVDAIASYCKAYGKNIAVQGELMGPGIQKNRENLKQFTIFVYNIFDIDTGKFLGPKARWQVYDELLRISEERATFSHVPVLHLSQSLYELGLVSIADFLAFAEGPSINHPRREGVVFKSLESDCQFKAIANSYLLKDEE